VSWPRHFPSPHHPPPDIRKVIFQEPDQASSTFSGSRLQISLSNPPSLYLCWSAADPALSPTAELDSSEPDVQFFGEKILWRSKDAPNYSWSFLKVLFVIIGRLWIQRWSGILQLQSSSWPNRADEQEKCL